MKLVSTGVISVAHAVNRPRRYHWQQMSQRRLPERGKFIKKLKVVDVDARSAPQSVIFCSAATDCHGFIEHRKR